MIISIRGTNGSGKSTVAQELLDNSIKAIPMYGLLGIRVPEAYQMFFDDVSKPVYLLGPYLTAANTGFDGVKDFDHQVTLLRKYVERGHVVFEGLIASKVWGRVGAVLEEEASNGNGSMLVYLSTSIEECIRRVKKRREDRGITEPYNTFHLEDKHRQTTRNKAMVLERELHGIGVTDSSSQGAAEMILAMLETSK